MIIYLISLYRGQGERDGRALVFTSLIISNLALILTSRASAISLQDRLSLAKNRTIKWIFITTSVILMLVLYVPTLQKLFLFSTLHAIDLVICLTVGILSVIWLELLRKLQGKRLTNL